MPTLEQHITHLQEIGKTNPITDQLAHYLFHIFRQHYVDKDNKHQNIAGKEGFVDNQGHSMTLEQFFKQIETPEPPERQRFLWKRRPTP
jgi:trehalose/maltose hydrolase-like predicted phosphorylase